MVPFRREFTSRRTREAVSRHGATWHKSQWDASLIILAGTLCNCDGRVHAYLPEQILRQLEICVYRLSFFSFLFFFFASPSDFRWTGNTRPDMGVTRALALNVTPNRAYLFICTNCTAPWRRARSFPRFRSLKRFDDSHWWMKSEKEINGFVLIRDNGFWNEKNL